MSLSLVFHLISALSLVGLLYWIVRLREIHRFSRLLWRRAAPAEVGAPGGRAVVVDWPYLFLAKLCRCLDAEFTGERGPKDVESPGRIEPESWLDFHRACGICSVTYKAPGAEARGGENLPVVEVRAFRSCDPRDWEKRLESSLSERCVVKLVQE